MGHQTEDVNQQVTARVKKGPLDRNCAYHRV